MIERVERFHAELNPHVFGRVEVLGEHQVHFVHSAVPGKAPTGREVSDEIAPVVIHPVLHGIILAGRTVIGAFEVLYARPGWPGHAIIRRSGSVDRTENAIASSGELLEMRSVKPAVQRALIARKGKILAIIEEVGIVVAKHDRFTRLQSRPDSSQPPRKASRIDFNLDRHNLEHGIDEFYKDSRNTRIPIDSAIEYVRDKLRSKKSAKELEEELTRWRNIVNK